MIHVVPRPVMKLPCPVENVTNTDLGLISSTKVLLRNASK